MEPPSQGTKTRGCDTIRTQADFIEGAVLLEGLANEPTTFVPNVVVIQP